MRTVLSFALDFTLKKYGSLILAGTGAIAIILAHLLTPDFIEELENRTWDWRAKRLAGRSAPDSGIKIITIDQSTLDFFAEEYALTWPFPREIYAHLIDFLAAGRAKGVAFDILFTESSAQSPEGDRIFAESAKRAPDLSVVHALVLNQSTESQPSDAVVDFISRQDSINILSDVSVLSLTEYSGVQLPIPELLESGDAFGYVQAHPDSDGIFRRHNPLSLLEGTPVFSLPFALLHAKGSDELVRNTLKKIEENEDIIVKLHEKNKTSYEHFSFAEIIQSAARLREGQPASVTPEQFRDAWVFVGTTAPGLLDFRPTSTKERGDGVEFLANTLDSALNNSFIIKAGVPLSLFFIFLHLAYPLLVKEFISSFYLQVYAWAGGALLSLVIIEWGALSGYWIPFIGPFSIYWVMVLGSVSLQYFVEGKQHRFLRKAFQQYVSPSLIEQIVTQPELLSLGGEKKEISILFSDIAGFTSASEKLEAAALVQLLNEYLSLLSDIILKHEGTVDKYIGDAILAFWNAPLSVTDHATRAVHAATECQKILNDKRPYFEKKYGLFPETRIGINTAMVSVGNFGSEARFDYTVIGDGVNLASRLEGANKVFGTNLIVSEASMTRSQDRIIYRPLGEVRVLGKNENIKIFEPVSDQEAFEKEPNLLQTYLAAYEAFQSLSFKEAERLFTLLPDDPVSRAYLKRMKTDTVTNPVWILGSK